MHQIKDQFQDTKEPHFFHTSYSTTDHLKYCIQMFSVVEFKPTTHHITLISSPHNQACERAQHAIDEFPLDSKIAICNSQFLMREENENKRKMARGGREPGGPSKHNENRAMKQMLLPLCDNYFLRIN